MTRTAKYSSTWSALQGTAGKILPSWLMSKARKQINDLAGSQRALNHGNLAPNHYWNKATNTIDKASLIEQMERELNVYGISSWKWYCHTDPAHTGNGFQMDDDNAQWFIEESRKRGMKLISVHKGYSYQSRTLGHLANPKDVEKAALRNPDFNFVVYHSAIKHGSSEGPGLEREQPVRSDDRRFSLAQRPDGYQEAQPADEQRLLRAGQFLQHAVRRSIR